MEPSYLDNNATTRCDPAVVQAMLPFFTEHFGNASSIHAFGSEVGKALKKARSQVQALRRDIQFIFQDPFASLDPRLTVGFSIMEPLLVHKVMGREDAQARVDWLLEKVGLPREHAQREPQDLRRRETVAHVSSAPRRRRDARMRAKAGACSATRARRRA